MLALALVFLAVANLAAQEAIPDDNGTWILGGSIGVPGARADFAGAFFTVGFHGTLVGTQRLSPDFSVGTMPFALLAGVMGAGARGGLALPIQVEEWFYLMPSAGVSAIGAVKAGPPGGMVGVNAGFALAAVKPGSLGMRLGATAHRFRGFDDTIWLVEFGLVRLR